MGRLTFRLLTEVMASDNASALLINTSAALTSKLVISPSKASATLPIFPVAFKVTSLAVILFAAPFASNIAPAADISTALPATSPRFTSPLAAAMKRLPAPTSTRAGTEKVTSLVADNNKVVLLSTAPVASRISLLMSKLFPESIVKEPFMPSRSVAPAMVKSKVSGVLTRIVPLAGAAEFRVTALLSVTSKVPLPVLATAKKSLTVFTVIVLAPVWLTVRLAAVVLNIESPPLVADSIIMVGADKSRVRAPDVA